MGGTHSQSGCFGELSFLCWELNSLSHPDHSIFPALTTLWLGIQCTKYCICGEEGSVFHSEDNSTSDSYLGVAGDKNMSHLTIMCVCACLCVCLLNSLTSIVNLILSHLFIPALQPLVWSQFVNGGRHCGVQKHKLLPYVVDLHLLLEEMSVTIKSRDMTHCLQSYLFCSYWLL